VRAASEVGLRDVGENYVAELEEKKSATQDLDLTWYFLGALQTNKILRVTTPPTCSARCRGSRRSTGSLEPAAHGDLRAGRLHERRHAQRRAGE